MRLIALTLRASVSLLSVSSVSAIYQDEAYQIDYQHVLLGTPIPEFTFFHKPSSSSRASLLYTLSERNVVGAINPKDGSLVWRQSLGGNAVDGTKGVLRQGETTSHVYSGYGESVSSWDAASGKLNWQHEDEGLVRSIAVPPLAVAEEDPVVLSEENGNARITRLRAIDGTAVWQFKENAGDIPLAVTSSASGLYYVSLQSAMLKGYRIILTKIDAEKGTATDRKIVNAESEVTSEDSVLLVGGKTSAPIIAWVDKSLKTLKVNILGTSHIETLKITSQVKGPVEKVSVHSANGEIAPSHFLVHFETADSHWAEVYHINVQANSIKKAYDLPLAEGKGAISATTDGADVFFTRITNKDITLVLSHTPGHLGKWDVKTRANYTTAEIPETLAAATEVGLRGQSTYSVRSALLLSSGDLELTRNGEPDWTRHESLAGITKAAFAELPASEELAQELAVESHSNVLSAYIHRVKRHVNDLQHFPAWLQGIPGRVSASLLGGELPSTTQSDDSFGFRKIIVAATEKGRLVGIDAASQGKVLWNTQAVNVEPGSKWNVTDISIEEDLALVMASDAEFVLVETLTGNIRQYQKPGLVEHVDRFISISKGGGKRTLIPIFVNGAPGGIPPGEFTNTTFIVTQRWDGAVTGWHVQGGETPTGAWIFSPPKGDRITAVAQRPSHDPVASIGRALGDRDVLYKYLSPNLVVVAAVNDAKSTASVYLLDTVTGRTLHQATHERVDTTQEISVTFSENLFAYTLHTDPSLGPDRSSSNLAKGQLFTISELFESPISNDRGPLGASANYSSLSSPPHLPHVVTASYVVPAPLSHLTTTSTKQGITPRSILTYSAPLAALLAIPVPFLSPRRPVGRDPTAGEREEGLFPYAPYLDLSSQWTISHKRDVLGIKGIVVTPTLLESSSLVFAYGDLDVFGTKIAPIGTFDLLGKGFNKGQLILTVVALAIGTRMLAPLARRKQTDGIWKS